MARFGWRTGAVVVVVAISVLVGMMMLAQGADEQPGPPDPTKPTMAQLDFAVWGSDEEIAAYQSVVDAYNAESLDTSVTMSSWPTSAAMLADVRAGKAKPDLYLLPRSELAATIAEKANLPLLDLVNEREIPIGDDFAREAVQAFSVDGDLQCMPYTVSPMVIYYNTDLVDFEAMEAEDLPVPKPDHCGLELRRVPGRGGVREPAATEHPRRQHRARRCAGSRPSSTPAAGRSSTRRPSRRASRSARTARPTRCARRWSCCATRA